MQFSRGGFLLARDQFASISGYRDSDVLAQECEEKAEIARKDTILNNGINHMNSKNILYCKNALDMFESISGWKNADELAVECEKKIEELKDKAEEERKRVKHNKKTAIVTISIVCAIITFVIILNTVIIPNGKYNDAIALMDAGNVDEAYSIFMELGNYRNAVDKAGNIRLTKIKEKSKSIKAGNYITFGAYEQDNNTSNGKEDIEWLVLDVKDGEALVISKYALDGKKYNESDTMVTWKTCTLREWLNNDFINSAFSEEERAMISMVKVSADKNPEYSTDPGNATQDCVFLLSITEANKYFSSANARTCKPTTYAEANGAYENVSGNCLWWLRSPGRSQNSVALVNYDGTVYEYGHYVDYDNSAVRPAMWIEIG